MVNVVFVTGGAGYVGSHACKTLSRAGFTPVVLDNLSTGWYDAVKFGPFEEVDLVDRVKLGKVFQKHKPVAIMHFAAFSQVSESVRQPGKYWGNNLIGSLNLIEAAVDHSCKNFIFSSTCATYGDQDNVVLNEKTLQSPTNPYGASKRAVEEIVQQFAASADLKYVIFRYFNVAGSDPEREIGEFHRPETHLIPLVLDAVLGKRNPITIFGTNYDTPDGTCIRDYVHVCDLVDAHVLGLKWLQDGGENRIYNLGTGHGFSVREVIESVQNVTGREVPQIEGARRPGDCTKLVSGSNLAKEELGWTPERSNLQQMIEDAWQWHQTSGYKE
ncbi:UDP-glucose 4-epimerase GalE [bacterium]|nr:UDP-glucose 4-epimerase GalE [bacterium]